MRKWIVEARRTVAAQDGQALLLMLALLLLVSLGAVAYGQIAQGIGQGHRNQSAADLAALAGGRSMQENFDQLFMQAEIPGSVAISRAEYMRRAELAAVKVAVKNGVERRDVKVSFPDASQLAPTQIKVIVRRPYKMKFQGHRNEVPVTEEATAQLTPAELSFPVVGDGNEYKGPLVYRQGKPMRPDVAMAFDRLYAAAKADGVPIVINSAFRSNAEQAVLFAANPNPRMVAPPGKSLHRLGTELDLGPPGSMPWVAAHAKQFHFVQRYSWEAWHFGYTLNAGSSAVMKAVASSGKSSRGGKSSSSSEPSTLDEKDKKEGSADRGVLQSFVPAKYAPMIIAASQRWNVSAALLAAQLYAESNFNEHAVSSAGAQGIAQFMPGTAAGYGIDPFNPRQAIDAQAHMMRDLLRQFGEVRLALAAYNAGPAPVSRCHCVPPYPETQKYVVKILGMLKGAGDIGLTGGNVATVRLVE